MADRANHSRRGYAFLVDAVFAIAVAALLLAAWAGIASLPASGDSLRAPRREAQDALNVLERDGTLAGAFALGDAAAAALVSGRLDGLLDNRTAYNFSVKLVRYEGESLADTRAFSYAPAMAPAAGEVAVVRRSFSSGAEDETAFGVIIVHCWWK